MLTPTMSLKYCGFEEGKRRIPYVWFLRKGAVVDKATGSPPSHSSKTSTYVFSLFHEVICMLKNVCQKHIVLPEEATRCHHIFFECQFFPIRNLYVVCFLARISICMLNFFAS